MFYPRLMLKKIQARLNNFADPFLEGLRICKSRDFIIGLIILLAAFAALASLSTQALINGDAAVYLQQMKNLDFSGRPVHLGYYLLGAGFIRILPGSTVRCPADDDHALNLLNCFLGAFSIMLAYFITFIICQKHIPALASSLFLLTHYMFLENSIYAEVYTPQVCFLLLAIFLWLLDRPILTALAFLVSFLITPSAVFALPLFFILRPRLRPILLFCATFFSLAAVIIFPVRQPYFFGGRGLFKVAARPFNLTWALNKEACEVFSSFSFCLPFVVAGLLEIFARRKLRSFAVALLTLWAFTLFLAEKINDVPPQLPTYALLCVVGGLGFGLLLRISESKPYLRIIISAALILAVAANGFNAFKKVRDLNRYHTGYRNTAIEISKVAAPDYLVIGSWTSGILFEHYVFQKSYTPYWINTEWLAGSWGKQKQDESNKKLSQAIAARRQIWLLGNYPALASGLRRFGYKTTQFDSVYVANAKK